MSRNLTNTSKGGKARAAGVSGSSFLDLKAELAKKESEYATKKGGKKDVDLKNAKGTVWARTNKGLEARRQRDIAAMAADKTTTESARNALERKAEIYEKLRKGRTGGLSEAQVDALLVDFDAKEDAYENDSDDVDESLTVPKAPDDIDDPIVEFEDEFGRMRTARRSEIPRNLRPPEEKVEDIDPFIEYNPVNHFPVYEPSADRIAAIEHAASEEANPLNVHYDASRDNRAKGAAFYTFSADEEARKREMEALKRAREETEAARQESGATDVRQGENEGLGGEQGQTGGDEELNGANRKKDERSRAVEKRKREIEERRKLVEAKRRKVKGLPEPEHQLDPVQEPGTFSEPKVLAGTATDPFAALEASSQGMQTERSQERTKGRNSGSKPDGKDAQSISKQKAADDFLAKLELDLTFKKGGSGR